MAHSDRRYAEKATVRMLFQDVMAFCSVLDNCIGIGVVIVA